MFISCSDIVELVIFDRRHGGNMLLVESSGKSMKKPGILQLVTRHSQHFLFILQRESCNVRFGAGLQKALISSLSQAVTLQVALQDNLNYCPPLSWMDGCLVLVYLSAPVLMLWGSSCLIMQNGCIQYNCNISRYFRFFSMKLYNYAYF